VHDFRRLVVWQRARVFARGVYRLTAAARPEEKVVTAQLRRSALSIGATVAEGCGKRSRAETVRFLEIACGSAAESEHHLTIAVDLEILPADACGALINEAAQLQRMLRGLMKRLPQ
jgi:four helix bundle protein